VTESPKTRGCLEREISVRRRTLKRMLLPFATAGTAAILFAVPAFADIIPYANVGTENTVLYTFTATSTGSITAYFAGSTAAFENQLGMLDNGVLSAGSFCLDNQGSNAGDQCNLGNVTAGDTLVFVLHDLTLGMDAYSDATLNGTYDGGASHNHVYSTAYTATSPIIDSIPVGTYVAFEDLPANSSDFNYNDETFVFTNVSTATTPEPGPVVLFATILLGLGFAFRRRLAS